MALAPTSRDDRRSTTGSDLIDPEFPPQIAVSLRRFSQGRRDIPLGEAAAETALPRMATALPWLRSHTG